MTKQLNSKTNETSNQMIWANLLHLAYNVYSDREAPEWGFDHISARPHLRVDKSVWDDLLVKMAEAGLTMVVIELGDGVRYESHPEIAVGDAWSVDELRGELTKMHKLGLEPIPKFNFSTAHDAWLGQYARCVSTDAYYTVCRDLIAEAIEIFDTPRFFHLGMDEETAQHQRYYEYVVIRQYDLWWRDLYFYVDQVEKGGVRAWIWSDYMWQHPEAFFKKMPKSVLQSNWYYDERFDREISAVKAYLDLEAHGYDQIPTGSNWATPENFEKTVRFGRDNIASERLLGFLQTPWKPALEEYRQYHMAAIAQVARARTFK